MMGEGWTAQSGGRKDEVKLGGIQLSDAISHPVMSIDARLKVAQPAACPNPSRKAKRGADGKRQKNLCVVFHAVLQYT
jgi:hypothetical protein